MNTDLVRGNKVLAPSFPVFRKMPGRQTVADGSILSSLVSQMVRVGAHKVYVEQPWRYETAYNELPKLQKDVVVLVDDRKYLEQTELLLAPIFSDLGITHDNFMAFRTDKSRDPRLADLALTLVSLQHYLVALDHQLMLDFDIPGVINLLKLLQMHSKSFEAVAHIDALLNIFVTYEPVSTGGLSLKTADSGILLKQFENILADKRFGQFSSRMHEIGVPDLVIAAVAKTRSAARKLASKVTFSEIVDYTETIINASTKALPPLPKPGLISALLSPFFGARYLPPTTDMRQKVLAAHEEWKRRSPPFAAPKGYKVP